MGWGVREGEVGLGGEGTVAGLRRRGHWRDLC